MTMWDKALWWKEYKQVKWLVWLIPIVNFFFLGLQRMDKWILDDEKNISSNLNMIFDASSAYGNGSLEIGVRVLLSILLVILAGLLVGAERRNGVQEITFSMPFSRQRLYWTKWMLGFVLIVSSLLLNTIIDILVVQASPIAEYFSLRYHLFQMVYNMFILTTVYASALFIGTLSGSMASQLGFCAIFALLPTGLSPLIHEFLYVHAIGNFNDKSIGFNRIMDDISLLKYLSANLDVLYDLSLITAFVYLIVSTFGGFAAFSRNRAENNGKLMLFPAWESVLKVGFIICCSLLGAAMMSGLFNNRLMSYYIGLLLAFVVSTLVIRHLTRIRWKV
jgi:acetoin utilization transport system permease protein